MKKLKLSKKSKTYGFGLIIALVVGMTGVSRGHSPNNVIYNKYIGSVTKADAQPEISQFLTVNKTSEYWRFLVANGVRFIACEQNECHVAMTNADDSGFKFGLASNMGTDVYLTSEPNGHVLVKTNSHGESIKLDKVFSVASDALSKSYQVVWVMAQNKKNVDHG